MTPNGAAATGESLMDVAATAVRQQAAAEVCRLRAQQWQFAALRGDADRYETARGFAALTGFF